MITVKKTLKGFRANVKFSNGTPNTNAQAPTNPLQLDIRHEMNLMILCDASIPPTISKHRTSICVFLVGATTRQKRGTQ